MILGGSGGPEGGRFFISSWIFQGEMADGIKVVSRSTQQKIAEAVDAFKVRIYVHSFMDERAHQAR